MILFFQSLGGLPIIHAPMLHANKIEPAPVEDHLALEPVPSGIAGDLVILLSRSHHCSSAMAQTMSLERKDSPKRLEHHPFEFEGQH